MEKSGKGGALVCITVIISVGIISYAIICFGKSIERSSSNISEGMMHARTMSIPSSITLNMSSSSIEKASKNIADGLMSMHTVSIPSSYNLNLTGGSNGGFNVNLNRTGN